MKHLQKAFGVVPILVLLAVVSPARAQMAVVDVGAITRLIQQIEQMREQLMTARSHLDQARQEFESMTGRRGMEQLLSGTVRNYLPPDWQALERALRGMEGNYSALSSQLATMIDANAVLTPVQLARISDQEREQLEAARRSVALLQATSRQALDATSERFAALQQLINAIPAAEDQKAVLDLQARISAEQAMLLNEQTKLMVLYQAAQAEEAARRQRASELAISNIGSLRRLPAIGLNE
jgi:type IV secretion system protein VirB5